MRRVLAALILAAGLLGGASRGDEIVLLDFSRPLAEGEWGDLRTPVADEKALPIDGYVEADQRRRPFARSAAYGDDLHPVKLEISGEHASSGKYSLKLTYSGGRFPTVTTSSLPIGSLTDIQGFYAEVTAP